MVAIVNVQHSHLVRTHLLDPSAVPLIVDKLGSAKISLLGSVSASQGRTGREFCPESFHKSLKGRPISNVASIELALLSDFADVNFSQSDLALTVHLLLLLLLHRLHCLRLHIILPDTLLCSLSIVLRILALVAVIATICSAVHGGIALGDEVDGEVGVLAEEVANEIARLVLRLHFDLHLPLQDHLLHVCRSLVAELVSLDFGSVRHRPPAPGTGDSTKEEGDDASLARNVHAESGARGDILDQALHPSGPLEEGQELLALLQLASHVTHPVRRRVLLVMQTLPSLLCLLLRLQKLIVLATALVIARSISDYSGKTLADKCLSNIDPTNHDGATEFFRETSLARLCTCCLHIVYSHLHLMTNQFFPEELSGLKHERHIIKWSEVWSSLRAAVRVLGPWWPD